MIFSSSDILSAEQLKRLTEHKYSSSGSTLLDPFAQVFWNWVVTKLPVWISPNLLTVTGLFVNVVTSLILICYSPDASQEAPRWTFALCALGMFVYQTLDACDGKQARRTGTSSPLGELFDHGCDSLSTVFVSLAVCVAVQLGSYPGWMFFQCFAAMALFYCAHWQTYVSGTLHFGKFDVTEVQCTIIIILLTSAVFGPSVWSIRVPVVYLELKLLPVLIGAVAASFAFYGYFTIIFTGGAGRNGSTVAGTSILSPLIPVALVVVPAFVMYQKSVMNIYENHPCLYILTYGVVSAKVTNRLVVAHMTKSELDYFDSVLIGPGMLFLNQYFDTYIDEYIVLWLCLVYSVADLFHYCIIVCNQICTHLNIKMFRITPKLIAAPQSLDESDESTKNVEWYKCNVRASMSILPVDDPETADLLSNEMPSPYQHSSPTGPDFVEIQCPTVNSQKELSVGIM